MNFFTILAPRCISVLGYINTLLIPTTALEIPAIGLSSAGSYLKLLSAVKLPAVAIVLSVACCVEISEVVFCTLLIIPLTKLPIADPAFFRTPFATRGMKLTTLEPFKRPPTNPCNG